MRPRATIYFDLDGVLARYVDEDSRSRPFMTPSSEYFRRLPPNPLPVALARILSERRDLDVRVLTRVLPVRELVDEWTRDKTAWTRERCPFVETPARVVMGDDKNVVLRELLERDPDANPRAHVLVDDDPRMLQRWVAAGGSGVQYVQPNHRVNPWSGAVIGPGDDLAAAMATIERHVRRVTT